MLVLLNSTKTMEAADSPSWVEPSVPVYSSTADQLAGGLKSLSIQDLERTLKISPALAKVNYSRYQNWSELPEIPALWHFQGEVFASFNPLGLSPMGGRWVQNHLRILSGLYGILKPWDKIKPYRLEMTSPFTHGFKGSLTGYWKNKLSKYLLEKENTSEGLVNLASHEYSQTVAGVLGKVRILTPIFQDYSSGVYKVLGYYSKQARGTLARWLADTEADRPEAVKDFKGLDYRYMPEDSWGNTLIFRRTRSIYDSFTL